METVAVKPFDPKDVDPTHLAARFAAIVESSDDAIISKTLEGVILTWNRGAERIFGYMASEVIGKKIAMLVPPNRTDEVATILSQVADGKRVDHFETVRRRKDGTDIVISVTISPIHADDGRVVAASKVARDITSQTLAAVERDRFFDLSIDMMSAAAAGAFSRVNPAFYQHLGYSPAELIGQPLSHFLHPADVVATSSELARLAEGAHDVRFENRFRRKDGVYRWLSWRSATHTNGVVYSVARDVTEDRTAKESMAAALREKEVLLQEVHHRVKNNLQVISSLISMQIRTIETKSARAALDECQSRIQAIALIHEKLYQSKDFGRVSFADYMRSLATNIFDVAGVSLGRVHLALDIGGVTLPVDKAIPCGLMVNELIINAIKHAFPADAPGRVSVSMSSDGGTVTLVVEDDGIGLPAGFDVWAATTLGLQLVCTLAEQLEATLVMREGPGARFQVSFTLEQEIS